MYYCEGKNCSRKDKCAYHEIFDSKHPRQYLDQSTEGYGFETKDENGNNISKHYFNCGDNADYYRRYKALGYRDGEEYKNSLNLCYDEECVNCEYRSLCFTLLEDAGLITHNGERIMNHICESVKKNSLYYIDKLEQKWGRKFEGLIRM